MRASMSVVAAVKIGAGGGIGVEAINGKHRRKQHGEYV